MPTWLEKMLSSRAHEYLSGLRFDPCAERRWCNIPLGGIYWSDEIPDFKELHRFSEEDRQGIYRLFSIRFQLWSGARLSAEDDIFWCYCERAYPECPIFRRTTLTPDDRKAQDECEAETIKAFDALFGGADKLEVKTGLNGEQVFSATYDLTRDDPPVPFWKRLLRRWKK